MGRSFTSGDLFLFTTQITNDLSIYPGKKLGFTGDNNNFHNISLGQGQEIVAEQAMDLAAKEGHWVILQNVHLVAKWLSTLEKKIEQYRCVSCIKFIFVNPTEIIVTVKCLSVKCYQCLVCNMVYTFDNVTRLKLGSKSVF